MATFGRVVFEMCERTNKQIDKQTNKHTDTLITILINSRTSIKRVWNMVNKISGKRSPTEVKHLHVGGQEVTTVTDIGDTADTTAADYDAQ